MLLCRPHQPRRYTVSYDAVLMPGSTLISSPLIVNNAVFIRLDLCVTRVIED